MPRKVLFIGTDVDVVIFATIVIIIHILLALINLPLVESMTDRKLFISSGCV